MVLRQAQDVRGELVEPLSFKVHRDDETGPVPFMPDLIVSGSLPG